MLEKISTLANILAFSSGAILCIISYIYYKFKEEKRFFDFFSFSLVSLIAFGAFVLAVTIGEKASFLARAGGNFNILASFFLLIFSYETIKNKEINNRVKIMMYPFIAVLVFSILDTTLFKFKEDIFEVYDFIIGGGLWFAIFLLIAFNIKEMSSDMKNSIIYIFVIAMFMFLFEWFGAVYLEIPEISTDFFVFNTAATAFFLKHLLGSFREYHETIKELEPVKRSERDMVFGKYNITEREKEVAVLVLNGKSNQEIAEELFISINTVKMHVYNIYKKFDVKKRAEFIKRFK